jgi:CRISPR/Cas system-associated exonuclease Cas4 (RecB family)
LKFQTAITPLLSDLERSIWHRWIPLVKQLLLSQKSSKIKKYIFCEFRKNFYLKRSSLTRGINGVKFIAVACLITQLWPFKVLKFQTAITPLLSDLERWIWHRWIPLVKQLLLSQKSSKIKKYIFCEFRKNFYLKRSSLTRGIQRCKIYCRSLLNNAAMAV